MLLTTFKVNFIQILKNHLKRVNYYLETEGQNRQKIYHLYQTNVKSYKCCRHTLKRSYYELQFEC